MNTEANRVQPLQQPAYQFQVVYQKHYQSGPKSGQQEDATLEYVEQEDAQRVFSFFNGEVITSPDGTVYKVVMQEVRPL